MADITDAKRRIIERLKRIESVTASDLAAEFGLTDTAVRQHLDALQTAGLVASAPAPPAGRGRPPVLWSLTSMADDLFPDRHGELTAELIESIREAFGEEALAKVVETRAARQLAVYNAALAGANDMTERTERLAALRTAEGYVAEVHGDGSVVTLVEHHCPIRAAASCCSGLCDAELALFRRVLGDDVSVTRVQHLAAGDGRCAHRVEAM